MEPKKGKHPKWTKVHPYNTVMIQNLKKKKKRIMYINSLSLQIKWVTFGVSNACIVQPIDQDQPVAPAHSSRPSGKYTDHVFLYNPQASNVKPLK